MTDKVRAMDKLQADLLQSAFPDRLLSEDL
jgi:hypothetical protein